MRMITIDIETFGITQRSLKMLRDTITKAASQHIAVFEIPTNDLCCSFLILNRDTQRATFTGDGFRMDGGGEGGAGYRSAQALLDMFGIRVFRWETINIEEIYQGKVTQAEAMLLAMAREIDKSLDERDYVVPLKTTPGYIRRI